MKTVGELKKYLEEIPDNTPIAMYQDGMEQSGYLPRVHVRASNMALVKVPTYDRFDGTNYSYERYESYTDGPTERVILFG